MTAPWVGTAVGAPSRPVDAIEVRRALHALADPSSGVELRALPSAEYVVLPGSDLDGLAAAAERLSEGAAGVYYTLNPIPAALPHRTRVGDVLARRWLLIDVDPVKAEGHKDESATDEEKAAAYAVAEAVTDWLADQGWPLPVLVDSGNGYQSLYRIDLPNDAHAAAVLKRLLGALAARFDGPGGRVDTAVHNASRIAKLPGTWACKGPDLPDRPHRMAMLLYVPPGGAEVVSLEQLNAVAGVETAPPPLAERGGVSAEHTPLPPPNGAAAPPWAGKATAGGGDPWAYGKAALARECMRVEASPPGTRNNALNTAALRMGQLVAGGGILRQEVEAALFMAALRVGLGEDETRKTIRSGVDAGLKSPRGPKVQAQGQSAGGAGAPPAAGESLTICAADVTPQAVPWLWPARVPKRFITVFAGRTGLGKSFVTCDIIARITTAGEIPFGGGECFEPGGALVVSEDPFEYVLAPRLIELGADLRRVRFMTLKAMAHYFLHDAAYLARAFAEVGGCKFVMIDPPTNFLGDVDEHKNAEVRQTLMHLVGWVQTVDASCSLIMHNNKQVGKGIEALNRVMGSIAWVSTSRIAHSFAPDPEDPEKRLFVPMKNNLGPMAKALSYRILPTDRLARVEWLGEVDITADDAMNRERPKKRRVVAADWLASLFPPGVDELPSATVWEGKKGTTLSDDALKEAKEDMGIRGRKKTDTDGVTAWFWHWPPAARTAWMLRKGSEQEGQPEE